MEIKSFSDMREIIIENFRKKNTYSNYWIWILARK